MKLLGVDYGKKRIGIAISDEEQKMAFPKAVYLNDKNLVEKVANFCRENSVGGIVLGESKDFKGKDNPIMKEILKFKTKIEVVTKLPVFMEPEFMTSAEVESFGGGDKILDASAAAIILQSYLNKKR